jgi:hypothetical protein
MVMSCYVIYRFQSTLELAEDNDDAIAHKYQSLSQLSVDFLETVKTYSRLIISEQFLSVHRMTIRPSNVGGTAGGVKYIARGILFKLCNDPYVGGGRYVYGGNHPLYHLAAKACSHDLKGAAAYFRTWFTSSRREALHRHDAIRVPIEVIVEYRGYRLTAMPFLSLQSGVIYGSGDGGETIHNTSSSFNAMMATSARALHLAPHFVNQTLLHSAGDVEGRCGNDGRYYLLVWLCLLSIFDMCSSIVVSIGSCACVSTRESHLHESFATSGSTTILSIIATWYTSPSHHITAAVLY